jgi:glycosyltransferase involved in cell wall biosynthesis
MRVLIVCEHASARFGGEASLPLHYFRVLRSRGVDVSLLTHARTRNELTEMFPDERRIHYVEDSAWHRLMWRIGARLPAQIAYLTTGFLSRLSTQMTQRGIVRRLVKAHEIDVIHQPMPVSPREPSLLYGFGIPVVMGPMNGGMQYPTGFRRRRGVLERISVYLGRSGAAGLNWLIPGKRHASTLLVANARTREALPKGVCSHVVELVENGVDLMLWRPPSGHDPRGSPGASAGSVPDAPTTFVFMGRLVDWKAVDSLLHAFKTASAQVAIRLRVIGDGVERRALQELAADLGIAAANDCDAQGVQFLGFLSQRCCAEELSKADCLVLPSLLECGGAVVLEAMALAKPVIATAWGGPLDYLDESCGVLVEPSGQEAFRNGLAGAMVRLARSPRERAEMGLRGRAKILRDYDWEVKIDRMVGVYRDAITRGGFSGPPDPSGGRR